MFLSRGMFLLLVGAALLAIAACAEIQECREVDACAKGSSIQLATMRADFGEDEYLVDYQRKRKSRAAFNGENPDKYDDAAPLRMEPAYDEGWKAKKAEYLARYSEQYQGLAASVVEACLARANRGAQAPEIDDCLKRVPDSHMDPVKAGLVAGGAVLLLVAAFALFRLFRRRIDPVAQAATRLGLVAQQRTNATALSGEYKGHKLQIEANAPEAGEGDRYLRVTVMSNVDPNLMVRFGPVAPPTGLDLPDLDAPEIHDGRIPEGYKLRLSEGASAEELLSGDLGFQLREYDPVDVRIFEGQAHVTTWFAINTAEKVVEIVDLAIAVSDKYAPV
jgi:hypothetical protein